MSIKYNLIKHISNGTFGSADLVEYNGERVVLKRQRIDGKKISLEDCQNEVYKLI